MWAKIDEKSISFWIVIRQDDLWQMRQMLG